MLRSVRQNRFYLRDWQTKVGRDLGFVNSGLPILNNVVDGHTRAFQHGPATLDGGLYFDEGAIGPIHDQPI
jgi:hypothetical protein